jgi:hypothetical protein
MPPLALPALAILVGLLPLSGCLEGSSSGSSPTSAAAPSGYDAELALCVSATNRYRQSVGRATLARDERLEAYAAEAARHDGTVRKPHQYVTATNFGDGLVRAENELVGWPLARYGTVRTVVETGLEQMWREGAGGDHYRNMTGNYATIGCGIFVTNREVTVVQAFR